MRQYNPRATSDSKPSIDRTMPAILLGVILRPGTSKPTNIVIKVNSIHTVYSASDALLSAGRVHKESGDGEHYIEFK